MTSAVSRQNRTLFDVLVPYSGIWANIATIIVGSLVIAAFAQLRFSLPWTPVPITGQTFAVLLVAATVGSRRGGLAAALYLFEGSIGLPFWAGGASGVAWSITSGGYIIGFIPAAFLVGFLAERGWDRGPWLLAALVAANALIYVPGVWWLHHELQTLIPGGSTFDNTLELGLWPFIAGDLAKIVLVSLALPAAWSLYDRYDPRARRDRNPDGNP
ncbi:MAG: biotin transporter BioY [Dehalococcoidia bacterium]|jgi:biotin transport system substrate-specific component|nr:biotin transporter BioY [Dehalococcoidia bacterium]